MDKIQRPPFVTPIEIIRAIASAFDIKNSDDTLDEQALKLDADYRYIDKLIKERIHQPISKYVSPKISNDIFAPFIERVIADNFKNIKNLTGMSGLSRKHALPILLKYIFAKQAASFLWEMHKVLQGPNPIELIAYKESSVSRVLIWLSDEEPGWEQYLNQLRKEKKENGKREIDKILSWQRGGEIPSAQSLANLNDGIESISEHPVNWGKVKTLLFTARAIDEVKRSKDGELFIKDMFYALQPSYESKNINNVINDKINNLPESCWSILDFIGMIKSSGVVHRSDNKCRDSKSEGRDFLDKLRNLIEIKEEQISFEFFLNFFEARWHVLSGELGSAHNFYKKAFQGALYRYPEILQDVIEEALVVAASLSRPDKTFLKRLKNISITFGYEMPLITIEKTMNTKKTSDIVEPWEIKMWKLGFNRIFHQEGFYPDVVVQNKTDKSLLQPLDRLRPVNLRKPDQEIKPQGRIAKSIPQIVYYAEKAKIDEVKALLDKGADVNVFSDIGDTAILMALKAMAIKTMAPYVMALNDMVHEVENFALAGEEIFNLLVKYNHNADILNTPSQITKTLPLNCAIETGRLDVVSKLLEMGADPNTKGTVDNISSLYFCINLMATVKHVDEYKNLLGQPPSSLEQHDAIRRYTAGFLGPTLRQQEKSISALMSDPENRENILEAVSVMSDNIKKYYDINELREIAKLLLSYGADKYLTHIKDGVDGFTPFKLAEEIKELEIFDVSVTH